MLDSRVEPHVLGPGIELCAEDVAGLRWRQAGRNGLVGIDVFERDDRGATRRLARRVALEVVEIESRGWRHHDVVARACGSESAVGSAPGHDARAGGDAALQDLVPAYEAPPVTVEEATDARNEPALQRRFVRESKFTDACLDTRGIPPTVLDRFVAADVDVLARKKLDHFRQDVFEEAERRLVGIEEIVMHAPVRRNGRRRASSAEPRIACDRGLRMARHFDFRDDGHEPRRRVGDDVADFILAVEAAVNRRPASLGIRLARPGRAGGDPPCADLR